MTPSKLATPRLALSSEGSRQPSPAKRQGLFVQSEGGNGVAEPVHLKVAQGGLDAGHGLLRFEPVGVGDDELLDQFFHSTEVASGLVVLAVFHGDIPRALVDSCKRPGGESEPLLVAGNRSKLLHRGHRRLESPQCRVDQLFSHPLRPRDRFQSLVEQHAQHSLGLERVAVLGEGPFHERLGFLARLLLLLSCKGLGLRGRDRLVPRADRRPLVRLRDFASLCFIPDRLGELSVERLQRRDKARQSDHDSERHDHDRSGQDGDSWVSLTPSPEPLGSAHRPRDDRLAVEEPPQVLSHCGGVREALDRVFLKGLQADRLQVSRQLGLEPRRRHWLLLSHEFQSLEYVCPLERRPADQHFVENRAQRVLVAQRADRADLPPGLLGRHVRRAAHDRPGARLVRVALHLLGQAEVGDLGLAVERQENVRRLQVPVDDAPRVRLRHRATELHHHRRRRSRRLRLAADGLGEAAPGDELQREVRQAVVIAVLVDLDNSRMLDLGDGAGFDVKPRDMVGGSVRPARIIFSATRRSRRMCLAL